MSLLTGGLHVLARLVVCAATLSVARAGEVRSATVDGADLAFVETGIGDPVILVHGGGQDYRFWTDLMGRLAARYRVIAYSRRNHFPNPTSVDGIPDGALDQHGQDLAGLVDALGLDRVRVVAHSSGAAAALWFGAQHPNRLRALVVNEPPLVSLLKQAPGGTPVLEDFLQRTRSARDAFQAGDLPGAVPLFIDAIGGSGTFARRSDADRAMALDNGRAWQADAVSSRPRASLDCAMIRRITAPVLVTNGERSPPFFHRIADELRLCLPEHEHATIAGASHTVPGENRDAFAAAVIAYFERH